MITRSIRWRDVMRRWWIGFLVLPALVVLYACGGSQPPPNNKDATASESCPPVDPGPPVVCPQDCPWDGYECRRHSGVIMEYIRDGGPPPPPPPSSSGTSSPP